MRDYASLIEEISAESGVGFRAASTFDLAKLEALGVPQSILDFYGAYEPSECVEGQIRLWPIEHILEENENLMPGCYVSRHGYVVFATTHCGDAYCFDLTKTDQADPGIVLISHESVDKEIAAAELARVAKPVARSLREFLEQFTRGEIDEECIY